MNTVHRENLRPMAKRKSGTEGLLRLLIVFVIAIIFIGSAFLIYQYFSRLNSPPRTYTDYQLRFWNEVLKSKPKDPGALTNVGFVYLNADKEEKAEGYFIKALKYDPKYVPALYNLGVYYKKAGKVKEAIKYLEDAAKYAEAGNKYLAYFTLGEIYQEQKQFDKAIEQINKSLEDENQIWNSYQKLGEIYEATGDKQKALDNYREAAKFNPSGPGLQAAIKRLEGDVQ